MEWSSRGRHKALGAGPVWIIPAQHQLTAGQGRTISQSHLPGLETRTTLIKQGLESDFPHRNPFSFGFQHHIPQHLYLPGSQHPPTRMLSPHSHPQHKTRQLTVRSPSQSPPCKQHLAEPSGSKHPSGTLRPAAPFTASSSPLPHPPAQHKASWASSRSIARFPCQHRPGRWQSHAEQQVGLWLVTRQRAQCC